MSDEMTEFEFASKVEWEGGVLDALDYGLSGFELPKGSDLRRAWLALEEAYKEVRPYLLKVESLLEDIETDDTDE